MREWLSFGFLLVNLIAMDNGFFPVEFGLDLNGQHFESIALFQKLNVALYLIDFLLFLLDFILNSNKPTSDN